MSTQKALASATTVASELLEMSDIIGTIASGKYADVIAVEGNPLVNIGVLKKVDFVMKGGEIIKNIIN